MCGVRVIIVCSSEKKMPTLSDTIPSILGGGRPKLLIFYVFWFSIQNILFLSVQHDWLEVFISIIYSLFLLTILNNDVGWNNVARLTTRALYSSDAHKRRVSSGDCRNFENSTPIGSRSSVCHIKLLQLNNESFLFFE